ncbi:Bacterial transcriptional activator domain family [Verrucomicrobiia bacterium DG1235]|nr:Bacterial transcriptional activator domain family [Verrucomicrobiae bacterium DG1235]
MPQERSHLAFTFWPDSEEKQALTNLRNLLHGLRQSLPDIEPFIIADKSSITLAQTDACLVDHTELKTSLQAAALALSEGDAQAAVSHLQKAVNTYQGPLFPKSLDEWIHPERESLQLKMDTAFAQLIQILRESGNLKNAITYSKIRIQHESLSEASCHNHIALLAEAGDRAAALLAYQAYEKRLQTELGITPGPELAALHQTLLQSSAQAPTSDSATPPRSAPLDSSRPPSRSRRPLLWLAAFAASVAVLIAYYATQTPDTPPPKRSLAILPFENRSELEKDRFFADGIHDDLITRVSHIPEVKIISRTSVMSYRDSDKDLKKIARELGVTNIIEGGVQRSGNQIRINIQLVDAATGFHLWAKNYTREISAQNIFALQAEVTEAVARELSPQLSAKTLNPSDTIPTENLASLEAYFRGKSSIALLTNASFEQGIDHFKRAIELDPNFAQAHAELANTYLNRIHFQGLPVGEQVAKAQPHIDQALQLNKQLSEAHVALGFLSFCQIKTAKAIQAFQRAIELNPNNAFAYQQLALAQMYQVGDPEPALVLARKAAELDPYSLNDSTLVPDILITLRRTDEAKAILEALLEKNPSDVTALTSMGRLYDVGLYRFDQAIRYYRQAFALEPDNLNLCSYIADAYFDLGDTDAYLEWSKRYLSMAPNSNRANFLRGLAHEFRGEIELATASYSALKQSDEYFDWSAYKLAAISVDRGRPQEAFDRYLKTYPWVASPDCPITKKNFIQVNEFAFLLHASGQKERAQALARRLKESVPQMNRWGATGYHAYELPIYIVLGDIPAATASLQEFIEGGGALSHVATDPFTREIHNDPEFKRLISIMNARLAAQKANLRKMEATGQLAPMPDSTADLLL